MAVSQKARVKVTNGRVHVHVSAETYYNLEAIQGLLPKILGPLGCRACCSGLPIDWLLEESEFET